MRPTSDRSCRSTDTVRSAARRRLCGEHPIGHLLQVRRRPRRSVPAMTARSSRPSRMSQSGIRDQRIASGLDGALGCGLVEALVIGKRVRIRPSTVRMHQRRAPTRAAIRHRLGHRLKRCDEVGPVAFATKRFGIDRSMAEMLPPAVWRSTGTEIAKPLSSTRISSGSLSRHAALMHSQNSPSLVAPSPVQTSVTSSLPGLT